MADSKVSALTAATSCAATDVFYLTADPAGTPLSRKIEIDDIFKRGTLTTDVKVIDAAVTWNEGATTFTGIKLNVTDTASAAASKLLDLQVGGTTKISFGKDGSFAFPSISGSASGGLTAVTYFHSSSTFVLSSSGIGLKDSTTVSWSASANPAGTKRP